MKNILITGTGRSGTSLVTGILNNSGYYSGDNLYPPRAESNPTGFFENHEINGINETILAQYDGVSKPWYMRIDKQHFSPFNPKYGQRWLSLINPNTKIQSPEETIDERILTLMQTKPFAYKDPRFAYTIDVWEKYLPNDSVIMVIYREPFATLQSMIKEINTIKYLSDFKASINELETIWFNTYTRLLRKAKSSIYPYFFLNYSQLIQKPDSYCKKISLITGAKINIDILNKDYTHQTEQKIATSKRTGKLYQTLNRHSIQ